MARPTKNYCDYFSHDRGMRDHKKIKAIRAKFGISGYGIWCMLLEYLTGNDGNVFEYSDIEFELMAGDFGVSVTEIQETVDYCIRLELLFLKDGFVNSESLDLRLKSVYDKRGVAKARSAKQDRINGKYSSNNTVAIGVSVTETTDTVTEMPQSKVNESKVNESSIGTNVPNQTSTGTVLEKQKTKTPKIEFLEDETTTKKWYESEIVAKLHEINEAEAQKKLADYISEKKPTFYEPYMALWNIFAKRFGLAQIDGVPGDRLKKFKCRVKEPPFDFVEVLRTIRKIPNYRGQGNNGWKVTWDYIFRSETTYLKIIEDGKVYS